jgi:hypothetical protein
MRPDFGEKLLAMPEGIIVPVLEPLTGIFVPFIEKRFGLPAPALLLPARQVRVQENRP